jgi:hypothetical protein
VARVEVKRDRTAEVVAAVKALDRTHVLVGFPASTAGRRDGELGNPDLAYIHENGAPAANIPARPFLRPGVERAAGQVSQVLVTGITGALNGHTGALRDALETAGQVAADAVKRYMVQGRFTPLKPATIRRKGSSRPLIDTGQLRQAVTFVVRNRP